MDARLAVGRAILNLSRSRCFSWMGVDAVSVSTPFLWRNAHVCVCGYGQMCARVRGQLGVHV